MRFSFRAELGGSFAGGSELTTGLFGGDCVVTDLRALLPVLCILRGSVVGVFQRRAGIVSGFCVSKERDLCSRQLVVGINGLGLPRWCSASLSSVGRAVPPRSARLLGRRLFKKSVTDLERLLRFAPSNDAGGLSRGCDGGIPTPPETRGGRSSHDGLARCPVLLMGSEAMLPALSSP